MDDFRVFLGGQPYEVKPIGFAQLKVILPRIFAGNKWADLGLKDPNEGGNIHAFFDGAEVGLEIATLAIMASTSMTRSEVEAIPATVIEAAIAIKTIGIISGALEVPTKDDPSSGEVHRGRSTGTKSTALS